MAETSNSKTQRRQSYGTKLKERSTKQRDRPSKIITLAGVVAGGLIGRKLGHGDTLTTLTGIAIGALGVRGITL